MATDAETRQKAIDLLTQVLLSQTAGHTQEEAQETATAVIDARIASLEGSGARAD